MLGATAFRITTRACEIRVKNGEDIYEVVKDYPRLDESQIQQLVEMFTADNDENEVTE